MVLAPSLDKASAKDLLKIVPHTRLCFFVANAEAIVYLPREGMVTRAQTHVFVQLQLLK